MLGYMLTTLAESNGLAWRVRTAGTHVAEGSAMSSRTWRALESIDDLGAHRYGAHRSHQLGAADVAWADVVLAVEADHVAYVRRHFPDAADRTVSLAQFVDEAPLDGPVRRRVSVVAAREPSADFDVVDPAGGDQAVYDECARWLWVLAQALSVVLAPEPG
jgi:protein-tyrosine-phosphatase